MPGIAKKKIRAGVQQQLENSGFVSRHWLALPYAYQTCARIESVSPRQLSHVGGWVSPFNTVAAVAGVDH